jgi:hypothetical protein
MHSAIITPGFSTNETLGRNASARLALPVNRVSLFLSPFFCLPGLSPLASLIDSRLRIGAWPGEISENA